MICKMYLLETIYFQILYLAYTVCHMYVSSLLRFTLLPKDNLVSIFFSFILILTLGFFQCFSFSFASLSLLTSTKLEFHFVIIQLKVLHVRISRFLHKWSAHAFFLYKAWWWCSFSFALSMMMLYKLYVLVLLNSNSCCFSLRLSSVVVLIHICSIIELSTILDWITITVRSW